MTRLNERQLALNLALCPPDELAILERQLERIVFDDPGVRTVFEAARVARQMQAAQANREQSRQAVRRGVFQP